MWIHPEWAIIEAWLAGGVGWEDLEIQYSARQYYIRKEIQDSQQKDSWTVVV
jgi:hypothetical protein